MQKSLFRKKSISKILQDSQEGYGDGEHGSSEAELRDVRSQAELGNEGLRCAG